jgi:Fe-Mn family superoxide dismutase
VQRECLERLRARIEGKPEAELELGELLATTSDRRVGALAAQVWNHDFYWHGIAPDGGGEPESELIELLTASFGSYAGFRRAFVGVAIGTICNDWVWLVKDLRGRLRVCSSADAGHPLRRGFVPLLALDVWEHAYYLDYRNDRAAYAEAFLERLVCWDFVEANLALAPASVRES